MPKCAVCYKPIPKENQCCNACLTNFQRLKIKERMVEYGGGKCQKCGYNKCHKALCFHHVDPKTKSFNLSSSQTKKWEDIRAELDKCVLLCFNCHSEEHDRLDREKNREKSDNWEQYQKEKVKRVKTPKEFTLVCPSCNCEFICSRRRKYCSRDCFNKTRKVQKPIKQELQASSWKIPTSKIAQKYNVSDKTVEKWFRSYNLDKPPRGYWSKKK